MGQSDRKPEVARVLAWLLGPPDQGLVNALTSGQIYEVLATYFLGRTGEVDLGPLSSTENRDATLDELSTSYDRCFDNPTSEKLLLVESAHKPWTLDPGCPHPMGGEKGLLLGDSALHMLDLYRQIGFKLPKAFSGWPDHLALELEFLAFLYENYSAKEVRQFLIDHLDWLPGLLTQVDRYDLPLLYVAALRAADQFVQGELTFLSRNSEE